jgi:hypothetical protein
MPTGVENTHGALCHTALSRAFVWASSAKTGRSRGQMQDWVVRAMQRWPNVPALFGWLGLDRRGRWLIQGEIISHPRIVSAIGNNYAVDALGRWYFQNGPQRGYIELEYSPFLIRIDDANSALVTHTGLMVHRAECAYLDEEGSMLLQTEHGAGEIAHEDLDWVLQRLTVNGRLLQEDDLAAALLLPSGSSTEVSLDLNGAQLPVVRLNAADLPTRLGLVRKPEPAAGEKVATRALD